jgi:uncharacterized protein (DUF1015 family)
MPRLEPFKGWRFDTVRGNLGASICPPYDAIEPKLAATLRRTSCNAVHLELPVGHDRFRKAAALWRRWVGKGILLRDSEVAFYVCEETFRYHGRRLKRTGVIGALAAGDPLVVKHERTLPKPKAERLALLKALRVNTSPIFGVAADHEHKIRKLLQSFKRGSPVAKGAARGTQFKIWRVSDARGIAALARALRSSRMLIADGHHRYEVGVAAGASSVLAYVCPESDPGLLVLPTHRIAPMHVLDRSALGSCRQKECASLAEMERRLAASRHAYAFGLVSSGKNPVLVEPSDTHGCRSGLAAEWIGRRLLAGVDPQSLVYEHESAAAVAVARQRKEAAIIIGSLSVAQIRAAVRRAGVLPPKTTYFFPKAQSGLVFKEL